jgi:hypothetical protein
VTLGYTLVLLDEQGVEIRREPDIYLGLSWIVPPDYVHGYALIREAEEDGETVRYFQRVKEQK